MPAQHIPIGRPVHEKERQGIAALVGCLPGKYVVYSNLDVPAGERGRTYEHDAIVVAPHGVFAVEMKSWGGAIVGNRDRFTLSDGHVVPSPIPLALSKARALKGQLCAWRRDLANVWVQGLVFLTAGDAVAHISPDFATFVVTLRTVQRALTHVDGQPATLRLSPEQVAQIRRWLEDRTTAAPISRTRVLADFELKQRLSADGRPYAAWLATPRMMPGRTSLLHVYALDADDPAERERARTLALREATLHERVRGGPEIFGYRTYHRCDDPPRILLEFDDSTPLVAADIWVRDRNPGLASRLHVLRNAAAALAHVHAKGLVHRRFSPEAILVNAEADPPPMVRLGALDLARDLTGYAPTLTGAASFAGGAVGEGAARCVAPEALRQGEVSPAGDLFAFGATAFALLAGRALFATPESVFQPFTVPPICVGDRPVPREIQDLVERLLSVNAADRPAGAEAVLAALDACLSALQAPVRSEDLVPGTVLRDTYELVRRLGRGATATTWLARHLQSGHERVLKVAPIHHIELLRTELDVLDGVSHRNLVRAYNLEPSKDVALLVLEHVAGATLTTWLGAGDPLGASRFARISDELLAALDALHTHGWLHRDVKPDNVMLTFADQRTVLLDLGLALRLGVPDAPDAPAPSLAVGTVRYKDPLIYAESVWSPANDQYSAFLTLYELLTGVHPFRSASPDAGHSAVIEPELFPDDLPPEAAPRLADFFRRALSPIRHERPATVAEARRELSGLLAGREAVPVAARNSRPPPPAAFAASEPLVLDDAAPDDDPDVIHLSARARGALARLGIGTLGQLATAPDAVFLRVPNVGRKTRTELGEWQTRLARHFNLAPRLSEQPAPESAFYPPLVGSPRLLTELTLTPGVSASLAAMGVRTLGEFAALPESVLLDIPHLTRDRLIRLRHLMARLAGREDQFAGLDEHHATFAAEAGAAFGVLDLALGLTGPDPAEPLDRSQIQGRLGLTRQGVWLYLALGEFRAPAGAGQPFLLLADELLGPVGVMSLERYAQALTGRGVPSVASPLGYARLTALLLRPELDRADAAEANYVLRSPWTPKQLGNVLSALGAAIAWPPKPRATVEQLAWDALDDALEDALVRRGADAHALLDALLPLVGDVRTDAAGRLYTPPVSLTDALAHLRPQCEPADADALVEAATRNYDGVVFEPAHVTHALHGAGFIAVGGHWQDPDRFPPPAPAPEVVVDAGVARQRWGPHAGLVAELAAQVAGGGFRVVALPPGEAHRLGPALASSLSEVLGADKVAFVDVDRVLVDALTSTPLWELIPYYEAAPAPDWRFLHAEAKAALAASLACATPGRVTVLGNPALLGTLSLMDWLGGLYDRARGGRLGLVVLAMPGGIHEGRVRLNERFTLAHTPDMAAVFLEAAQ
jgi:serine/threonine protein kinase